MNYKHLILVVLSSLALSCATFNRKEDLVGVYKVSSKDCKGNTYEKSSCEEIELLEIVKGNFYKVGDNEHAFVIWSGDIELNYNARKLDSIDSFSSFPLDLIIDQSDGFVERIVFSSSNIGKYESGRPSSLSTINFVRANLEELNKYSKEYPGNN